MKINPSAELINEFQDILDILEMVTNKIVKIEYNRDLTNPKIEIISSILFSDNLQSWLKQYATYIMSILYHPNFDEQISGIVEIDLNSLKVTVSDVYVYKFKKLFDNISELPPSTNFINCFYFPKTSNNK